MRFVGDACADPGCYLISQQCVGDGRLPIAFLGLVSFDDLSLQSGDGFDTMFEAELDGFQHDVFGKLVCAGLDH